MRRFEKELELFKTIDASSFQNVAGGCRKSRKGTIDLAFAVGVLQFPVLHGADCVIRAARIDTGTAVPITVIAMANRVALDPARRSGPETGYPIRAAPGYRKLSVSSTDCWGAMLTTEAQGVRCGHGNPDARAEFPDGGDWRPLCGQPDCL